MNAEGVRRAVEDIRASAGDPEAAHGMQDKLFSEVLRAVANGHPDARELAAAALIAREIEFPRWYA